MTSRLILVAGAVLASSLCLADTAHMSSVGLGNGYGISYNHPPVSGGWAGTLTWNVTPLVPPGATVFNYYTVCGDLYDHFSPGASNWNAVMYDSSTYDAGLVGASQYNNGHYVGANSVKIAGSIVGGVGTNVALGNLGNLNADQAVGLQVATWYALYGNDNDGLFNLADLASSPFQASGLSSAAYTAAFSYYNTYAFQGYNSIFFYGASGHANSGGNQDQFGLGGGGHILTTPEPVTMTLGFAAIGLFVRRKSKAKKA